MLIQKIFTPQPVFSQGDTWNSRCAVNGVATIQGFECLFQNILKILIPIAGLVFFAMFLVGGFKYLTSSGDSKKAAAASHTLTMAFIGLIGVIISWLILLFIERFTGVNVTEFNIPNNYGGRGGEL
jgi:hypothetical protein